MPDPILGRVLRGLERVYNFRTSQKGSPDSFELDLPIQPVHDLSSQATIGSGVGPNDGFWIQCDRHAHVAVGVLETTPSFRQPDASTNGYPTTPSYDPVPSMVWQYASWVATTTGGADFSYGIMAGSFQARMSGPVDNGGGVVQGPLWWHGSAILGGLIRNELYDQGFRPFPCMMSDIQSGALDFEIYIRSAADNAGTEELHFNTLFWLGPRGVNPPVV